MGKDKNAVPAAPEPTLDKSAAILWLNPKTLGVHPLAESLPMLEETDEKFLTMVADIAQRGVDEALKVVLKGDKYLVADGRHRRAAAIAAELERVPCLVRDETEVIQLIVGSLFARRHFSKSAQAYLAFPLFETLLEENRKRGLANLRQGKTPTNSRITGKPETGGKRVEDLAAALGISRDTFDRAKDVHTLFAKRADVKEEFEPQLLSGEMSLWNVLSAIAGRDATKGVTPSKRPPEALIDKALKSFTSQFSRWGKIKSAPARALIQQKLTDAIAALPEDLKRLVAKAAKAS